MEKYNLSPEEAIDAIEKNMPTRGTYTKLQARQTEEPCDYCKSGIDTVSLMDSNMVMRFVSPVNYCPNCGQKLDWREE